MYSILVETIQIFVNQSSYLKIVKSHRLISKGKEHPSDLFALAASKGSLSFQSQQNQRFQTKSSTKSKEKESQQSQQI